MKKCDTLSGLLETSDCISLHADLNDSSKKMINAENIAKMKRGVFIVVSRLFLLLAGGKGLVAEHGAGRNGERG